MMKINTTKTKTMHFNFTKNYQFGNRLHLNKDHQRMMVDPMFMIVQSFRSFLTAVTTTAVAPIAVILPEFT